MITKPMPSKLGKEPIVEATCEFQLSTKVKFSQIIVGILYKELNGEKQVKETSTAQLPPKLLATEVGLKYQPLISMDWNNYLINFSNHSFQVTCKLPYPGWNEFKKTILHIFNIVSKSGLVDQITRYSLKYVDFIECRDKEEVNNFIDIKLNIGNKELHDKSYQFNVEISQDDIIHLLGVVSPAVWLNNNVKKTGALLTTDSLVNHKLDVSDEVCVEIDSALERLHAANKEMFFNFLTDFGLDSLEPEYDKPSV